MPPSLRQAKPPPDTFRVRVSAPPQSAMRAGEPIEAVDSVHPCEPMHGPADAVMLVSGLL